MGNGMMHLCLIGRNNFKRPEITPQNYKKMLVKITVSFPVFLCVMVCAADNSVFLLLFLPLAHGKHLCISLILYP